MTTPNSTVAATIGSTRAFSDQSTIIAPVPVVALVNADQAVRLRGRLAEMGQIDGIGRFGGTQTHAFEVSCRPIHLELGGIASADGNPNAVCETGAAANTVGIGTL